jgi:hypothetical protein
VSSVPVAEGPVAPLPYEGVWRFTAPAMESSVPQARHAVRDLLRNQRVPVPDDLAAPNQLPADFFASREDPTARGAVLETPGAHVAVSADSSNPRKDLVVARQDLFNNDPVADIDSRIVEVRSEELIDHSAGVLDYGTDIEPLHDMRVATRRLRAVLEIFAPCFPREEHRQVLRHVEALADALGERRDRDVAIVALERATEVLEYPDRPGIRSLIETFRAEQVTCNEALAPIVDPTRLESLRERLLGLAAAARERAGP